MATGEPRLRDVWAATQVLGRRTALRYLAVGVGASLLGACGKEQDGGKSPGSVTGTGSGPVGRAVGAFLKGSWEIVSPDLWDSTPVHVEVADGTWSITPADREWENGASWVGQWAFRGGRIAIEGPTSPYRPDEMVQVAADDVPGKIGGAGSMQLPWAPRGDTADDELKIKYTKNTLRIVHITDTGRRTKLTATRL
ncbi:hypothetical protein [Streptomyces longisporoflavus]|uniref:Lipoprotein n=1 Tax=Streptomyces longisporoflavus TaxID=28044 RepID=A0ABW7QIN7_9ACTN